MIPISPIHITIAILAVTFALLIFTRLPPAAIFLGALTLTITFDLAPLEMALKGFNNPGVLTVGALFMIAAGMYSTGAISILSEKLIGRPMSVIKAQLRILPNIAFGSAFLNNTPLVAMMIPVIRDLSRSCGLNPRKLYIPLSYASILGGTCTLIGTATNLVLNGLINEKISEGIPGLPHMEPLKMFDLSWIGVPATIAGMGFIVMFTRWLLPSRTISDSLETPAKKRYFRVELEVEPDGHIDGRTLEDAGLSGQEGFDIICFIRDGESMDHAPDTVLKAGDIIGFSADIEGAKTLWSTMGLRPLYSPSGTKDERYRHHLVEAVVSRRNTFLGHRIGDLEAESEKQNIWLVGVARGEHAMDYPLKDAVVQPGDVVLLEVTDSFFYRAINEVQFSMIQKLRGAAIQRTAKALTAALITAAMVISVAAGWISMLNAALLASGTMLLTGCMSIRTAGRSVDFATLIVIASAMGLESAVTASGLSEHIGRFLGTIGGSDPYVALAVVFTGAIIMDALVTNVASAVFMFPIALTIASQVGTSFMPFVVTIMIGASCSFISPVSYQTNLMVYGPGDYSFVDFAKIGIPLSVLVGVITVFLTPVIFPFHP